MRWIVPLLVCAQVVSAQQFVIEPERPYHLTGDNVSARALFPPDGPTRKILTRAPNGMELWSYGSDYASIFGFLAGSHSFTAEYYSVTTQRYYTFSGSLYLYDRDADEDADDLSNIEERNAGTSPFNRDTDGDGYNDKSELDAATDPTNADSFPSPLSPYDKVTFASGGAVFEIVEQNLTWPDAAQEALSRKGRLAVLPTAAIYDRVIFDIRRSYNEPIWLGLSDAQTEGVWRWISNELLDYNRWETGEPNNGNGFGEHYAHLRPFPSTRLNDLA